MINAWSIDRLIHMFFFSFTDFPLTMSENDEDYSTLPSEHPRKLIPELCRLFYQLGWVTGK